MCFGWNGAIHPLVRVVRSGRLRTGSRADLKGIQYRAARDCYTGIGSLLNLNGRDERICDYCPSWIYGDSVQACDWIWRYQCAFSTIDRD